MRISENIEGAAARLIEPLPICQIGLQIHTNNIGSVSNWIDISQGDTRRMAASLMELKLLNILVFIGD